jgi:hypothetical protein
MVDGHVGERVKRFGQLYYNLKVSGDVRSSFQAVVYFDVHIRERVSSSASSLAPWFVVHFHNFHIFTK